MNDRDIMESILLTTKGVCDLYMHGTIESSTANVHQAFNCALNETLAMQDKIYKQMQSNGWYTAEQADANKINQLKQKFSAQG
ncbi:MAG: spore coat protein [Bacillota bacterium]|nr:spore coat protein [Bacillota bacterium]